MRMKDRFSKHKSTIRTGNLLLPVPFHFHRCAHNVSQLRFQIIEEVTLPRRGGNRLQTLRMRESFWIHTLQTLEPKGLNREYQLNAAL